MKKGDLPENFYQSQETDKDTGKTVYYIKGLIRDENNKIVKAYRANYGVIRTKEEAVERVALKIAQHREKESKAGVEPAVEVEPL